MPHEKRHVRALCVCVWSTLLQHACRDRIPLRCFGNMIVAAGKTSNVWLYQDTAINHSNSVQRGDPAIKKGWCLVLSLRNAGQGCQNLAYIAYSSRLYEANTLRMANIILAYEINHGYTCCASTPRIGSRQVLLAASSTEDNLRGDVETAAKQNEQLRQELVEKDKYFQV